MTPQPTPATATAAAITTATRARVRPAARLLGLVLCAALGQGLVGCASAPAGSGAVPPATAPTAHEPTPEPSGSTADEQALTERARQAEARGLWAEAVLTWEALVLLQPAGSGPQAGLAAARQRRDALVAERLAQAEALRRKGDGDAAAQRLLDALALDPAHEGAAETLRTLERERNRRTLVGRFSRNVLTRRAAAAGEMQAPDGGGDSARQANSLLEHSTLLARQGDVDGAIQMLRGSAALSRGDVAHKALLANLYVQKAEAHLRQRQADAARTAAQAALALDKQHAGALAVLQRLPAKARPAAPGTPGTPNTTGTTGTTPPASALP